MNDANEEEWDLVIRSSQSFLRFNFEEVWKYRDLLWMFIVRDFKAFYKQTILGPLWFFVQPLFTMSMYIFVFGNLAGLSTDGIPKPLFYLAGIMCWSYFSDCLLKSANVFRSGLGIFDKVYFPRIITPIGFIVSNLLRFFVQFILFICFLVALKLQGAEFNSTAHIFLFPFFVLMLALLGLGFGLIISSLTTKYRDLVLLLNFGVQLLMYATTVVYPLSSLDGRVKFLVSLNPISHIIEGVRLGFLGEGTFQINSLIYVLVVCVVTLFLGILVFNKVERNFIDTV